MASKISRCVKKQKKRKRKAKVRKNELITYARRVELLASPRDARLLDSQSRKCALLFNVLKETADTLRATYREEPSDAVAAVLYTKRGFRDLVPGIKEERPFLKAVHSSPLKNVALRLSRSIAAYQASHRGKRPGPKVQWPRFHKWRHEWFSLEYDEPNKGFAFGHKTLHLSLGEDAEGKRLRLTLPLAESTPALRQARALRIVKEGRRYFAILTLERKPLANKEVQKAVAIDPNHKNFGYAFDTDGKAIEIANMLALRALDARIDHIKRLRDRCQRKSILKEIVHADGHVTRFWKPSRKWHIYDQALKRAEHLRREQTKHYLFSLSNALCRNYDLIGVGDYAPSQGDSGLGTKANRQMKSRSLIGRFKPIIQWLGRRSGKRVIIYDESGTTRTCYDCKYVVDGGIHPKIREWTCPRCGIHHLRDENAAQNGLELIISSGNFQLPRSGPVQQRCDWRFQPKGWWEVQKCNVNAN